MSEPNLLQMQILKELLFKPKSRFSDLLSSLKITSDHLSYHLRVLAESKLVKKENEKYILTSAGKEFANRMDTNEIKIEKQPKISVVIVPKIKKNGKNYYIVQRRLKEPYFGYFGFMTGKIRFGETVFETAARELKEEMNLTAKKFKYMYLLHEMVYSKEGELLEDKFFNVIEATGIEGEIINDNSGENKWYSEKEFYKLGPKYHNEEDIYKWYKSKDSSFKEHKYYIEKF